MISVDGMSNWVEDDADRWKIMRPVENTHVTIPREGHTDRQRKERPRAVTDLAEQLKEAVEWMNIYRSHYLEQTEINRELKEELSRLTGRVRQGESDIDPCERHVDASGPLTVKNDISELTKEVRGLKEQIAALTKIVGPKDRRWFSSWRRQLQGSPVSLLLSDLNHVITDDRDIVEYVT